MIFYLFNLEFSFDPKTVLFASFINVATTKIAY